MKNTVTDIYLLTCTFTNSDYHVANEQCDDQIVTYLSDDDRNSLIILLIRALVSGDGASLSGSRYNNASQFGSAARASSKLVTAAFYLIPKYLQQETTRP